ncbi:MAG TPA: ABC transporter substrate-binding protein [Pseudonocardiaceae bacterium]|jgi:oligopeptide transport system substrate-binding protein|nr:ABC transporter substrate-binding protein [Pseudonocardiaceae bacterium]
MRRSRAVWFTATVVTVLVLIGCAQPGSQQGQSVVGYAETADQAPVPGKPGGTFRLGRLEPTAIDPYNVQESEGIFVAHALFTGLVEVSGDGTVSPGVAEDWTVNADCSQWSFTLKRGTTFHNGEPVTAESFQRGWQRVAGKDSGSEVAYHLDEIQGYPELRDGSAATFSGVDATDPNVLRVTLAQPDCEFMLRTSHPAFSPVPAVAGRADNQVFNNQPIGNGPFMMDGPWLHNHGIRLVRFENYTIGHKANLDAVEISMMPADTGLQAEYNGFVGGQFDFARIPTPLLAQSRASYQPQGKWISKKTNGSNYLLIMVTTSPLNNPDARKAISLAIDRTAIVQGIFQGAQTPATTLIPRLFPNAYQPGVCTTCRYDPGQARKLAGQSGLTPGTMVHLQFNTGGGHEEWTAAMKQQLEQNLGLRVNYTGVPFSQLLDNAQQPSASGMFVAVWIADYPTPANYLIPLLATSSIGAGPNEPTSGDNRGRYSNPEFDRLLLEAQRTKDEKARNELYQQAERIAIGRDLALIPLWERQQYWLADTQKFGNIRIDFNENPTIAEITLR